MIRTCDLCLRRAALGKRDARLVQTCLCGQDRVVELLAPGGNSGFDPRPFELARIDRLRNLGIEELHRAGDLTRKPFGVSEDKRRRVLFELDLAFRCETSTEQSRLHDVAE